MKVWTAELEFQTVCSTTANATSQTTMKDIKRRKCVSLQYATLQSITHTSCSIETWLVINPVPWRPCCPVTLSAVHGDHLITTDRHAEVHRWRLQRGPAGRKETLLFPGGQTLHVLVSNWQLLRESKRGQRRASSTTGPPTGRVCVVWPLPSLFSLVFSRPRRCWPWSSPAGRTSAPTSPRCRTRWRPWSRDSPPQSNRRRLNTATGWAVAGHLWIRAELH